MYRSLLLILILFSFNVSAQTLAGKVVSIADGDTFTLLTEEKEQVKIRLHGIDCPEKNQAYGQKAKDFLSELIFGKEVEVEVTDTDRYKRKVGIVFIDGISANEALLIYGYAWHYKQYDKSKKYAFFEEKARGLKLGLWADKEPIAPWEFRKKK